MDDNSLNKKMNILITIGIIIIILIVIFCILLIVNKSNNEKIGELEIPELQENSKEEKDEDNTNNSTIVNEQVTEKIEEKKEENANNVITNDNVETVNYNESDVVDYFENKEDEVENNSFKEKFKDYFVEIVDFIFYGTEIKGHTFNDLTSSGKLKVISIALKIDSFIDSKVPGYKETISGTSSRIYNNAKEKLTTLYLNIASDVCEENDSDCENAKELFGEIKSTCKVGWAFIKGLLKTGGNKLKDWYEIYRES